MTGKSSLFAPSTFSAGGGFLDNVDAVIAQARVVTQEDTPFDAQDADSAFMKLTFQPDAEDSEPRDEYYRFGGVDRFTPSTDHKRVVREPDQTLIKSTKAGMFFAALVNAGFAESDLPADDDVTFLEGMHVHVKAIEMPEMKGGSKTFKPKAGSEGKKPTVVVIAKILEPLAAKKGAAKTAPKTTTAAKTTKAAPAAAAAASGDVEEAVVNVIIGMFRDGKTPTMRLLPTAMLKQIADTTQRPAAFKLVGNKEWIGNEARPWTFDAASGELGPNEMTAALIAE